MNQIVSIIVPCYNQAQYLSEALQSVSDQTYANWECIIVNDGSPDNTDQVAGAWLAKDSRFLYVDKENGGLSSARNWGIKNASGEFILTLDADDKYECTFVEKAIQVLNDNPNIGGVTSWGIKFFEDKEFDEFKPVGGNIEHFLFRNSSIGTLMFRKKCWEAIGGYDEKMRKGYEDWEFFIRLTKAGWTIEVLPEVLFFYRQHSISMRTVAINSHDKEIKRYIYTKHKDLYSSHYDEFLNHFLDSIEREKREKIKNTERLEFRIGSFVLKPLRWIKSKIK